ncbi:hypothetical protein PFLU4_54110 [Pseudomonas fluorescens]|nr:hypothetical protein PFLU4_54110 [Pseudomonas fluorescens]
MHRWRLERRHREQARSHMGCGVFTELQLTKIPVGAELARDGIALVYQMHRGVCIAGKPCSHKLSSHMGCGVFTELQLTKIPVGAELARDGIALVYQMHRGVCIAGKPCSHKLSSHTGSGV